MDKHNSIPVIVARIAEVPPIVHICGQSGETFVMTHGVRCWRRRPDAVGTFFCCHPRNHATPSGPSAQPRKFTCACNKLTSSTSRWVSASIRIAGLLCGTATTQVSELVRGQDGQRQHGALRTTDTAARNRSRTECKHAVEDFLRESIKDESGLVQDNELVTRNRFVNEAQKQEQPLTQIEAEGQFDAMIESPDLGPVDDATRSCLGSHHHSVDSNRAQRTAETHLRVAGFGNSLGGKGGCNNTMVKFRSPSGQSRSGDDGEMFSSAGRSLINYGKVLDPHIRVQSEDLGGSETYRVKAAMRPKIMLMIDDIKGGRGFLTVLRQQRAFLDTTEVELTDLPFSRKHVEIEMYFFAGPSHHVAG